MGAGMALFVGRFDNKIDKKGRVSVPKPFRDVLAGDGFTGVYLYPSFRAPAIEVCGEAYFRQLTERMDGDLAMFSAEQDDLLAAILHNAHAPAFDPEGRIVIAKELLDYTGIINEARFVGNALSFQIWHPATHDIHRRQGLEKARAKGLTLPPKRPGGPGGPGGPDGCRRP